MEEENVALKTCRLWVERDREAAEGGLIKLAAKPPPSPSPLERSDTQPAADRWLQPSGWKPVNPHTEGVSESRHHNPLVKGRSILRILSPPQLVPRTTFPSAHRSGDKRKVPLWVV